MLRFICDVCGTAASTVFCHTDSISLCSCCDDFIHAEANCMAGHHFRIPIQTTANPFSSLLYGEFLALNHYQAETEAAAAREELFYYGSDNGKCFDDPIAFTSSCSNYVLRTSCDPHQGIQKDCDNMNVPITHSVEQDQTLNGSQMWIEHPDVTTIQTSPLCALSDFQTFPTSVSCITPEIKLSFTKQSGQRHHKAKTAVECLANPSAENPISREERVQRFREKRQAKKTWKKMKYPSKKAYAASVRPRINGKFARKTSDKKVDSN